MFGVDERLTAESADRVFDRINACLADPAFLPRALFERFNIEVLATTESPLDPLAHHAKIRASGWKGRVVTAYRPDPVVDPEFDGFRENVHALGALTNENTSVWSGYLAAHRQRRAFFRTMGATSTDHGHPTATTCDLPESTCQRLLDRALSGTATPEEAEQFRGQMLTEMARMSLDDGLVMQIHPGSFRNHNPVIFRDYGRDNGADIPTRTDYVRALKPLLDRFGNERASDGDPVHAGRIGIRTRAGAARRPLPGAEARPGVVVPRQPARDAALPRADDGDRRFPQHGRLQR